MALPISASIPRSSSPRSCPNSRRQKRRSSTSGKTFEVPTKKSPMIGILPNLPANVAGFRATGLVTKEDYEKVVFPEVERHKKMSERLNFVFFVDTPMKNFSLGAWIRDLWLGLKGFAKWNKVAIISD